MGPTGATGVVGPTGPTGPTSLQAAYDGGNTIDMTSGRDIRIYSSYNSTEQLYIQAGGNIGIGTTDPGSYKLYVAGNQYISGNLTTTGTITAGSTLYLPDGSASSPALTFTNDTNTGLYRLGADKIGLITGGVATQGITIDSSGNVGIGTTGPGYLLTLQGTNSVATVGDELITNDDDRDFDTDTGNWSGTNWTISGGKANHTAGANYFEYSPLTPSSGKTYQIKACLLYTSDAADE